MYFNAFLLKTIINFLKKQKYESYWPPNFWMVVYFGSNIPCQMLVILAQKACADKRKNSFQKYGIILASYFQSTLVWDGLILILNIM